ncbi:MAG: adenylate/guanylate cyclase domain-containing protein [Parvularculaceae bacterium]
MAKTLLAARLRWLKALPLLAMVAVLAVLALMALANADSRHGGPRERLFDLYARIFPADIKTVTPFQIIEIDRESLEKIGPWPWPRSLISEIVGASTDAGAKGVIYVEGVDGPDPLSPKSIGDFWLAGSRDPRLAEQLSLLPNTDQMLAEALANTSGAISVGAEAVTQDVARLPLERADGAASRVIKVEGAAEYFGLPSAKLRGPINSDLAASAALTVAALPADSDGVVRTATLLWSAGGRIAPVTALEAADIAGGGKKIEITADETSVTSVGQSVKSLRIGDNAIPLGDAATMRLYFPRRVVTPTTPAWKALQEKDSLGQLDGKVVFIGLGGGVGPTVKTARGEMTLPDAQAIIARQIEAGITPSRPAWFGYAEALSVLLFGAAAIMWSQRLDFWKAVGVAAILSAILFAGSLAAFAFSSSLVDPLAPSLALFLGAFTVAGGRSLGEALKDDKVRGAFQGSLPEPTMKRVREEGSSDVLGGARRAITVLACELRLIDEDITRLADTPGEVTNLIAAGCVHLKKAIIDAGGAAEQADGGRIFAYFNAPLENADHVRNACAAALRLVESMDKINIEIENAPRFKGAQLHLAIGIATGECFVGPMGHGRSNRYSAVGKPMELASFLSRQAIAYGPAIICDETVHRRTDHHFAFLELDRLKTRNEERPFSIYALVGNPFIKSSKGFRALEDEHRQMLAAYRSGDFLAARAHLNKVRQSPGAKIALFDLYEERISKLAAEGGADGAQWDGAELVTF